MTAGHDNWYKDAYPWVMRDYLQPVYDAIGVREKEEEEKNRYLMTSSHFLKLG